MRRILPLLASLLLSASPSLAAQGELSRGVVDGGANSGAGRADGGLASGAGVVEAGASAHTEPGDAGAAADLTPGDGGVSEPSSGLDGGVVVAKRLVAILPFESNEEGKEQAPGVTSLIASHLSEDASLQVVSQSEVATLLAREQEKALLGVSSRCEDDCLSQISHLLGARYVVSGRLDRFGKRFVLTAGLFDSKQQENLGRPKAEASRVETLPAAVRKVAGGLMAPLGASLRGGAGDPLLTLETDPDAGTWSVGMRVSNSFIHQLAALNPGADLDVMYRVHQGWHGFLQVGFKLRRAADAEGESGFSVVPSVIGARHVHRLDEALQPYWGAGVGLQLRFGDFGVFTNTGPLPTVTGLFGLRYLVRESIALSLEGSTNVAQLVLGIAGTGLSAGLNIDVTGGVSYLF